MRECMTRKCWALEIGYEQNTCASARRKDYRSLTPLRLGRRVISIINLDGADSSALATDLMKILLGAGK